MSDYNDGLLPEPCLRMDTHFGDEYESVEFGDGTGYVKAAPMLVRLGALHVELDELRDDNAKLRELCHRALVVLENNCSQCAYFYECDIVNDCKCVAPMHIREELLELGVEKGA